MFPSGRRDQYHRLAAHGEFTPWCDQPEEVRSAFESLDDAMFAAIDGCHASLEHARDLWYVASATLDARLVEESREQYLRYAVDVMRTFDADCEACPERTVAALEIISLLTEL